MNADTNQMSAFAHTQPPIKLLRRGGFLSGRNTIRPLTNNLLSRLIYYFTLEQGLLRLIVEKWGS